MGDRERLDSQFLACAASTVLYGLAITVHCACARPDLRRRGYLRHTACAKYRMTGVRKYVAVLHLHDTDIINFITITVQRSKIPNSE